MIMKIDHEEKLEQILHPKKAKYEFLQDAEDEEVTAEIDYEALVDLSAKNLSLEKPDQFDEEKDAIIFYCKDCKSEQEVSRLDDGAQKKVKFQCNECGGKNVLYGTQRGVKEYYERKNK